PAGAIQSRTDFGNPGYGGACPPEKDAAHHYEFTIWALDVDALSLDENASGAMVGFFLNHHQLDRAVLTAVFDR
ncbi:MAG TPA: YbhB/YbcL family Raf kinase inhibitor-like protein, partial [Desulfobacterales bacterium]|nr:YbhB/YbcL family Raf kinase inhibitor-like protein [Desulfobacterales bacterium]